MSKMSVTIDVTVNTWPDSQSCMSCKDGALLVDKEPFGKCAYICMKKRNAEECETAEEILNKAFCSCNEPDPESFGNPNIRQCVKCGKTVRKKEDT